MKDFRKNYKTLAQSQKLTRAHHLQLALLKALTAKTNTDRNEIAGLIVQSTFTKISNEIKLVNGYHEWNGLRLAINETLEDLRTLERGGTVTGPLNDIETPFELIGFKDILEVISSQVEGDTLPETKYYTYIFVRTDLSQEQQVVQSAHVALELGYIFGAIGVNPNDLNFVVCSAKDEFELKEFEDFFNMYHVETTSFIEPDQNNTVTAFATFPIKERIKNKYFLDFMLLSYGEPVTVSSLN